MHTSLRIPALLAACLLSGCAYNVSMMPRDSGTITTGKLEGFAGSGTMTVNMGGETCTGPASKVASNQTFGFATAYGSNNRGLASAATVATSTSGDSMVKALLSCTGGGGLRCDLTGRGSSAGGICVADNGKVYDVVLAR